MDSGGAAMPLNLSNRDQSSGHLFYNRRLRSAITRFSVRMKHDDRKQQAALALAVVFVLLGCAWMALLNVVKPAGLVGESVVVGDRDTGALYAKIDGRLHPALNLASARLATGSAAAPAWVTSGEIAKLPTGPLIGIAGIPDGYPAGGPRSAWALCDTARAGGERPVLTAIAGDLSGGRAEPMDPAEAILARHAGATYLIWNGRRTRIDASDRAVAFTLGLDPKAARPVEISTPLFDAIPATEPLAVPRIPGFASPSRLLPGARVGQVLETRDATGTVSGLYVLLPEGVQQVSPFVADLLRASGRGGIAAPQTVSPDRLVALPQIRVLAVDYYPTGRLRFVDSQTNPVTCVSWTKLISDPQASVTVLTGRGLPTPQSLDSHIVDLVRGGGEPGSAQADRTLVLPGAARLVVSTSGVITSDTRESLFWVSPQGVRFGIAGDQKTLQALGIDPLRAVQAPWPMLRTFAPGPEVSQTGALVARDALIGAGPAASLTPESTGG